MKRYKTWTLTDVEHDIWLDTFTAGGDRLPLGGAANWSIRKRTLHGGLRDGVDLIEVDNGAMKYSLLPTRGMGLWNGNYRGLSLGWKAPVLGPVHPKFVNLAERGYLGWLTGFDEWLVRCGLSQNGPPGEDAYTDRLGRQRRDILGLHGKIANRPAHHVEVRVGLDAPYELSVVGQVEEGSLFAPRLHLTSSTTTVPGSNRLVLHDLVENRGGEPAELQMLYHLNMGAPFLEAGSRVVAPFREVSPISKRAAEGIDTLETYAGPVAGYAEQVYCYDLLSDAAGRTLAMLYNHAADKGLAIRCNRQELPCLTVWKNTASLEEGYVTGLEPGTNYPNLKTHERHQGRVPVLPPGGHWECSWSIEIHDSAAGVSGVLKEIVSLQSQAKAIIHRTPQAKFSGQA